MATEHGGNTTLPRGTGLLGAVVAGVRRRLGDDPNVDAGTGVPNTTRTDRTADRPLTPEEHVVDALHRSGGAMRQSEIVEAVDWSESTVSRKLSDLESKSEVSRYQIGREKLVCLPGHEPAAVESSLVPAGGD